MKSINAVKTIIADGTSTDTCLLRLKDGRIASCFIDKTIRICELSREYCEEVIGSQYDYITLICELDAGTIVSCLCQSSIIIGDYDIQFAHELWISKVIALPDNRIASCGGDSLIKIWKSNKPYSKKPIKVLEGHRYTIASLLYIKERDILISGSSDKTLRLWNMSTYQCTTVIEGVYCWNTNSLYMLNDDRVIVGGEKSFCIVDIDKCVIEQRIEDKSFDVVTCFLKLRDDNTILCGSREKIFILYDMKTQEYTINELEQGISTILFIDDNTFVTSENCTITV